MEYKDGQIFFRWKKDPKVKDGQTYQQVKEFKFYEDFDFYMDLYEVVNEEKINDISSGVSMESASYMENNNNYTEETNNSSLTTNSIIEEYTPKLFAEDQNFQENSPVETKEHINDDSEQLFDQDINEEDFEIPAFLRKQKF